MTDLFKTNGSSPPRVCGTTTGTRCWRATLRARRRVDHWCDDAARHLGACVCAGCGVILATRPAALVWKAVAENHARAHEAERAAMDASAIHASNAEIRSWLWRFGVRVVLTFAGGGALTRTAFDGRLMPVMAVLR